MPKLQKKKKKKKHNSSLLKTYANASTGPRLVVSSTRDVRVCIEPSTRTSKIDISSPGTVEPPNGGWGWVVTACSLILNLIVIGMHNSFGVLYLGLVESFKSGLSETAWVGSISIGFIFLSAPFSGYMSTLYGCRVVATAGAVLSTLSIFASSFAPSIVVLYFTYGVGFGLGTSLCYSQGSVIVTRYFTTKQALASGITLAGSTVGALIMAPIYEKVQSCFGWRAGLRVVAAITSLTIVCTSSYRPLVPDGEKEVLKTSQHDSTQKFIKDFALWKNKAFLIWCLAVALNKIGYFIPWIHIVKLGEDAGLPRDVGSQLITYLGIAATISRLVVGKLVDFPKVNRVYVAQITSVLMGLISILHVYNRTETGVVVFIILYGACDGGIEILLPILTLDFVGAQGLSVAWGCVLAVTSLSAIGPPLAGLIRETTGSYFWALYLTGLPMIISALLLFLIPCVKPQKGPSILALASS